MGISESLADGGDGVQNLRRRGAGFQAALRGKLVHQAVGQRIAERHAQFQNVHARLVEGEGQFARGGQIRVARADIDDETLLAGALEPRKAFLNAIHCDVEFPSLKIQVSSRDLQEDDVASRQS